MRLPTAKILLSLAALCAFGAAIPARAEGPTCPRAAATQKAPKAAPAAAAAEKKETPRSWRLEAL